MPIGEPMPGASGRLYAALAPILEDARAMALRVTSIEDASTLERRLRERWPLAVIQARIAPMGQALRAHVLRQWGAALDSPRADAASDTWATRTARGVSRLFGSLRRGATQALREAQRAGESITATVSSWAEALPTRHGSLESRLAEELDQRVHETEQRWHEQQARRLRPRWRWRTQRDGRVRRKHKALEGETFAHGEQPSEGRPGEPYACRCWAEWIV